MIIDEDEYCSVDIPYELYLISLLPPPPTSWDDLTPIEQGLACNAYLNWLKEPDYYKPLYWDDPLDPRLVYLTEWAQYRENKWLDQLIEVDPFEYHIAKVEIAQQLEQSGRISPEEYVRLVTSSFLALGTMAMLGESGRDNDQAFFKRRDLVGATMSDDEVLDVAAFWLGEDYHEIAPGVFRSRTYPGRQFRMTTSDLADPRQGPHVHFEKVGPDGRSILENWHVPLR
jgi:hypothetical protein